MSTDFDKTFFDDTMAYEEPPFLFEYKGVGFSPIGGIQALSGQKKNGKSILVSVLMGCALAPDSESSRFAERFPGLRLRQTTVDLIGHAPRILYVDTEQEQENTDKVVERAKWLAELPSHVHCDRLSIQWLRVTPENTGDAADFRKKAILYAIDKVHPDLLFIDGIRDIIHDFNDIAESSELINSLMGLATKHQMCIWCTLHMNPRPSNDDQDGKMRGHLGTELGNKVSDTFVMRKKRDTNGVTFTMHQLDARGKDVEDLTLQLNDDAGPVLGAPIAIGSFSSCAAANTDSNSEAAIISLFRQVQWKHEGLRQAELRAELIRLGWTSHAEQQSKVGRAIDMGIVTHVNRKPYFFNKELADQWFDDPLKPEDDKSDNTGDNKTTF
jgi:hypothetical protein